MNYDVRLRNTPMESSKDAAKEALKDTLRRLEKLIPNEALVDERLTLNAVTPYPQVFETTFGREVSASTGLLPNHAKLPTLNVIPLHTRVSFNLALVLRIARHSSLVHGKPVIFHHKHRPCGLNCGRPIAPDPCHRWRTGMTPLPRRAQATG